MVGEQECDTAQWREASRKNTHLHCKQASSLHIRIFAAYTHLRCGEARIFAARMAEEAAAAAGDASVTLQCDSDGGITIPPWRAVAEQQHRSALGLTPQSFIEHAQGHPGTGYAFRDRNDFDDDLNRRIFIVPKVDDGCVFVFDEDGTLVDEPNDGTPLGRQVLSDPEHDSRGFLAEWANGYYEFALVETIELEEGEHEEGELEEGGKEVPNLASSPPLRDEGSGPEEDPPSLDEIAAPGKRIMSTFNDANGTPLWFSGLVLGVDKDGTRLLAYDDGEVLAREAVLLQIDLDGGTFKAADSDAEGVIAGEAGNPMAIAAVWQGTKMVGALVGETEDQIGGVNIHMASFVYAGAFVTTDKRTLRARENGQLSEQERYGHHTFRRGDVVQTSGRDAWREEQDEGTFTARANVVGVVAEKGGQTRKFLVLQCCTTDTFFLGTWAAWERLPARGESAGAEFDRDDNRQVQCMEGNEIGAMMDQFAAGKAVFDRMSTLSSAAAASIKPPPSYVLHKKVHKKAPKAPKVPKAKAPKPAKAPPGGKGGGKAGAPPAKPPPKPRRGGGRRTRTPSPDPHALSSDGEEDANFASSPPLPPPPPSKGKRGSPPKLPPGWKSAKDPVSGKIYYYNKEQQRRQYELPSADSPQLSPTSPPMPPPSPSQQQHPTSQQQHPTSMHSSGAGPSGSHPEHGVNDFFDEQRDLQIARLRGMLPYLDGSEKASAAGDLAALEAGKARMKKPRYHL